MKLKMMNCYNVTLRERSSTTNFSTEMVGAASIEDAQAKAFQVIKNAGHNPADFIVTSINEVSQSLYV